MPRATAISALLQYLAARLAKEFHTAIKPKDVWDEMLGDADGLTDFRERAVLGGRDKPVLVCLDEVDNVFNHDYRDSFFGLLRGCHNRRASTPRGTGSISSPIPPSRRYSSRT